MASSLLVSRINYQFNVHYDDIVLVAEQSVELSPGPHNFH